LGLPGICVLGSAKLNQLLNDRAEAAKEHLQSRIMDARKITVCVDGWTKKNLANSFLGISACFFDSNRNSNKAHHVVLSIAQLPFPHTGITIAECMETCLSEWQISSDKVLIVVSDNGSNMIKAIKILAENADKARSDNDHDDDYEEVVSDTEMEDELEEVGQDPEVSDDEVCEPETVHYRRMVCMAHSLQLVIKKAYTHYNTVLTKARFLVGKIRKSGMAVQKLHLKCGKTVFSDNATRWNSTFNMIKRLLALRADVNELLTELRIDSLTIIEWDRLTELCSLLEPFAAQTNILQSDSKSLSYAVPAVFDLDCHLQSFNQNRTVAKLMLSDLRQRFSCILQPDAPNFNPVPAASCLLDPTVAAVMRAPELSPLLEAAKTFILTEVCRDRFNKIASLLVHF